MPKIVDRSISILADGGLGMAMFSLGMIKNQFSLLIYHGLWERKIKQHTISKLLQICFLTGLFMASQASIIACGTRMAVLAMAIKFVGGPALMAVPAVAIGLRGTLFRVAIVQVQNYSFCSLHSG